MYSTRCDSLDGVIKSFPLGITNVNADNSPVHVTVLLIDLNRAEEILYGRETDQDLRTA